MNIVIGRGSTSTIYLTFLYLGVVKINPLFFHSISCKNNGFLFTTPNICIIQYLFNIIQYFRNKEIDNRCFEMRENHMALVNHTYTTQNNSKSTLLYILVEKMSKDSILSQQNTINRTNKLMGSQGI